MYINIMPSSSRQYAMEVFRQLNLQARLGHLISGNGRLKDFSEKSHLLNPSRTLSGVQDIPVECITGSLGRAGDFDSRFRPLKKHLRDRWVWNYLDLQTDGWAPIRVHRIDGEYFVEDGHHRVSVARHAGMTYIQAEVWEYAERTVPASTAVRTRPTVQKAVQPAGACACSCEAQTAG